MHITVREARIPELDAAGALTAAVYRDDALAEPSYLPRLADAAARHRAAGATQLVAVDPTAGDALVGAVVYVLADTEYADLATGREAEIRMLATTSAARGRGVGEALVRACVDLALAQRRSRLVLSTKPIMTTAHRLYERVGFVRTPERDWEFAPGKALLTFALPLE